MFPGKMKKIHKHPERYYVTVDCDVITFMLKYISYSFLFSLRYINLSLKYNHIEIKENKKYIF